MRQESADREPVKSLPRPPLGAEVAPEERDEFLEIAPIGDERVGGDIAFLLEVHQEFFDCLRVAHVRADNAPWMLLASIHACMSPSARSESSSRFRFLSRICWGRSSRRPKFAFIG